MECWPYSMKIHTIKVFKLARSRCCLIADKDSGGVQAGWMGHAANRSPAVHPRKQASAQPEPEAFATSQADCCHLQCFTRAANICTATQSMVQARSQRHHHIRAPDFLHPDHTVYNPALQNCATSQIRQPSTALSLASILAYSTAKRPPLPLH